MPLATREDGRTDGDDEKRPHDEPLECAASFVWIDAEDELDPVLPEQGDHKQERADACSGKLEPVAPSRPGSHSDSSADGTRDKTVDQRIHNPGRAAAA